MAKLAIPLWLRNAAAALGARRGSVTHQAKQAGCSRQTIYEHGRQLCDQLQRAERLEDEVARLKAELNACQQRLQEAVVIGAEQLERFAVTCQAVGTSLRQAEELLRTLLPAERVPDHATLGRWTQAAGKRAGQVLAKLDPQCASAVQTLCADEIFFGGAATLVSVEPTSLALLGCRKTGNRSAVAWQAEFEQFSHLELVISDSAKGIAAAVKVVQSARPPSESQPALALEQSLDVFHTNQEARRVLAKPWRQAEAAWQEAEATEEPVARQKQKGEAGMSAVATRREAWARVKRQLDEADRWERPWQRARAALAVFRPQGILNDRTWAEGEIAAALKDLQGPSWKKLRNFLTDPRALVFLDRMHARLEHAVADPALRRVCVRRWWLRHGQRSEPSAATPWDRVRAQLEAQVRHGALTPEENAAYERVAQVLRTTVRSSSAVEGINSVLRMQQGRHRKMTQGLLDLKRLYWNCRPLQTGKRRGRCPYEILGVPLPSTDFWTLLADNEPAKEELSGKKEAS